MVRAADDDGALRRHQARDPVKGRAKKRGWSEQWDELLGPLVSEETSHQPSQPDAVAPGEHDGPGLRREVTGEFRLREGLAEKERVRVHDCSPPCRLRSGSTTRHGAKDDRGGGNVAIGWSTRSGRG